MIWSLALSLNHAALLRVAAALFALAGLEAEGDGPETLPRHLRRAILKVLGPAESALRRLIFIAAEIIGEQAVRSSGKKRPFPKGGIPRGDKRRAPSFPLFDPRKNHPELSDRPARGRRAPGAGPRVTSFDDGSWSAHEPAIPSDDDEISAAALCRRLQALLAALNDMPKQAKRMARAMARR